jgi:hypothetical protein
LETVVATGAEEVAVATGAEEVAVATGAENVDPHRSHAGQHTTAAQYRITARAP